MIIKGIKDNEITGFKLIDNIENDSQVIGTFVKNSAELKILNLEHEYDQLEHTYIEIQNFGSWYVDKLKTDEEFIETTLSLYDITQKFDEPYQDKFSFPATMKEWATWIGEQVGIPLKGSFLNENIILSSKPYFGENPSWRNAIQLIAKYACGYAQTNFDNTYSIKWFENTLHEIEDWENFVHEKVKSPINIIVLSTGDTEDNVKFPEKEPENPHELRIEDDWNYIDRYSINETIYNQANGFCYTPISKLNVPFGILDLRAGQKIKTKDIELADIETNVSKVILEWLGGDFDDPNAWSTSITMADLKETNTNYSYANSIANRVLKVERSANKIEGEIRDLIQETSDYDKRITKAEQDVEGFRQIVDGVYDFTREKSGSNKLTIDEAQAGNLLELHITGELECLWPEDDLWPSDDLYPLDSFLIVESSTGQKNYVHLPDNNHYLYLYTFENTSDELVVETVYDDKSQKNVHQLKIIRRVAVASDGTRSKASKETIESYGNIEIPLFKGTNKIYMESFANLNYSVKYAIVNDVTEMFEDTYVTHATFNTTINQTNQRIEQVATAKLDNTTFESYRTQTATLIEDKVSSKDFEAYRKTTDSAIEDRVTTDAFSTYQTQTAKEISSKVSSGSIISTINQSAESVKINASKLALTAENIIDLIAGSTINLKAKNVTISSDNFNASGTNFSWKATNSSMTNDGTLTAKNVDLTGKITATSGKIGGFEMGSNTLLANLNYTFPSVTDDDMTKMRNYLLGKGTLTDAEKEKYDFNGDGTINSVDLQIANELRLGIISKNFVGTFRIDTSDAKETIKMASQDKRLNTVISMIHGVSSTFGSFNNLTASSLICSTISMLPNISSIRIITGSKSYLEVTDTENNAWGIDMWTSDKRLKDNIEDTDYDALEKITAIKHRKFNYKKGGHVNIGYIADELEEIDPDFIFEVGNDKIKQPRIDTIIPAITKAIQELQKKIEKIESRIT